MINIEAPPAHCIDAWIDECRDQIGCGWHGACDLYESYCSWTEEHGGQPLPLPTWSQICSGARLEKRRLHGRIELRLMRPVLRVVGNQEPDQMRPKCMCSLSNNALAERSSPLDALVIARLDCWLKSLRPNWAASRGYAYQAFADWSEADVARSGPLPDVLGFERHVERRLVATTIDGHKAFWKRPWFHISGTPPAGVRLADLDDREWIELFFAE